MNKKAAETLEYPADMILWFIVLAIAAGFLIIFRKSIFG
jgi:hypothetical protein